MLTLHAPEDRLGLVHGHRLSGYEVTMQCQHLIRSDPADRDSHHVTLLQVRQRKTFMIAAANNMHIIKRQQT